MTLANHNRRKQCNNQSDLEANTCNRRQARENAGAQVTFGFASHWLRKWREFANQWLFVVKQNQKANKSYF